jgi:hypothetical protein
MLVGRPTSTTYPDLSARTGLASSAVHAALKRAAAAGLALFQDRRPVVLKPQLREFLLSGAKYAFPAVHGRLTRGIPTASAAAPLNNIISPFATKTCTPFSLCSMRNALDKRASATLPKRSCPSISSDARSKPLENRIDCQRSRSAPRPAGIRRRMRCGSVDYRQRRRARMRHVRR